jgi:hypothetical protein
MSYVRVGILGTMTGGEVWSVNPVLDPTFEFGTTVDQAALDAASAAIAALDPGTGLRTYMSTEASLTGCRLEVRDDATDDLIAISISNRVTPLAGTSVAAKPAQTAIVFSLRTDTPGGSGRGRMYWPCLGGALDSTLRLNATQVTAALTGMVSYVHAMEAALATAFPTIGFDLAVRSKTTKTTPHVVRMQVGNVPDTQRRRRDALPEAYQSAAV